MAYLALVDGGQLSMNDHLSIKSTIQILRQTRIDTGFACRNS